MFSLLLPALPPWPKMCWCDFVPLSHVSGIRNWRKCRLHTLLLHTKVTSCLCSALPPGSLHLKLEWEVQNRKLSSSTPPYPPQYLHTPPDQREGTQRGLSVVDFRLTLSHGLLEMCQGITGYDHWSFIPHPHPSNIFLFVIRVL